LSLAFIGHTLASLLSVLYPSGDNDIP
jgi:hypothetical protein